MSQNLVELVLPAKIYFEGLEGIGNNFYFSGFYDQIKSHEIKKPYFCF